MKNNKSQNTFQQGDVVGVRVNILPEGEIKVISKNNLVLAEGESTGHFHGIESEGGVLVEVGGQRYLNTKKRSVLKHQEHKPITIEPGIWQIGQVQEYDYFSKMKRAVVD